ncbi:YqeG family HAD IIIA-type phosphatase [Collinsella sp. An2]|uniref:YqeG family HAD IIIA-type phosphatase n=1 Tax=Collinsella sp. An2 TaxID=1965585 RepID=UPI000B3A0FBE|nr:YqeG family HAD IIIA-type phosphatase [Collinsella sp. An2]OUP10160.1 haloacid dehalogenase [Collinsella sp. An2]
MSIFSPGRYVASVDRIDLDQLWASGKRAILLDRDNTLVPRDRKTAPPEVAAWLDRARAMGFKLYMVSNNWHRDQVERSARELGLGAISFACKPLPFALVRALRHLGVERDVAVMVGDQIYTDVWAGNFAGISSILVRPQTTVDLWYTRFFRIFERRALRGVPCEE